jgi:hypothetical protein
MPRANDTTYLLTAVVNVDATTQVTLRASTNGYCTQPGDTPANQYFHDGLINPYNRTVTLSTGEFTGEASSSPGVIEVANVDGAFDGWATRFWDGAEITVEKGEFGAAYSTFQTVMVARAEKIQYGLQKFTIVMRDSRLLLDKDFQERSFKGFGSAVRFVNGDGDYLGAGNSSQYFNTGRFTAELRFRHFTKPTSTDVQLFDRSGTAAGEAQNKNFSLYYNTSSGKLTYSHDYGAASTTESFTTAARVIPDADMSDGQWHTITLVRDSVPQILMYYDGVYIDDDYTIVNPPTGGGNSGMRLGRDNGATARDFDGDISEFRFFGRERTAEQIADWWDKPLTETDDTDLLALITLDEGTGTTSYNALTRVHNDTVRSVRASSQYTSHDTSASLTLTGDYTFMLWFKHEVSASVGGTQRVGLQASGTNNLFVYQDGADDWLINVRHSGDAGPAIHTITTSNPSPSTPMFIAYTYASATGDYGTAYNGGNYNTGVQSHTGNLVLGGGSGVLRFSGPGYANYFNGQVAQCAIFDAVVTNDDMIAMEHAVLTGAEDNLVALWHFDSGLTDKVGSLDLTLHSATQENDDFGHVGTVEWVGTGEGDSTMAGRTVPTLTGTCRWVPLTEVDVWNWVWMLAEGPVGTMGDITEGGALLTGVELSSGLNSDIWSHSFGSEDYVYDKVTGLVRFKSAPSLPPMAGYATGDSTYYSPYGASRVTEVFTTIARRRGGLSAAQIATLPSINEPVGLYTEAGENMSVLSALSQVTSSVYAFYYFTDDEKLQIWQAPEPETGTSVRDIYTDDVVRGSFGMNEMPVPPYRIKLGHSKNYKVLSESEIAGAASATDKAQLMTDYQYVTHEHSDIKDLHPNSEELVLDTLLYTEYIASSTMYDFHDRLMVQRYFYSLTLPLDQFEDLREGDVVTLYSSRYDLSGGKKVSIISRQPNVRARTLVLRLWR